ncbi:histamine H2 receptor-like [Anticarsia gemmatalis]|uniref:histamine H2 receptor-like n=1 Tax=Anticarsia gemmatalis TaxID=129554 RepID=UPI003F7725F2
MLSTGPSYLTMGNVTRMYSPVTLSAEWPTLGRLLFMVICSCLGTTINGFFVAAFFVERPLKRVGNVFLACVGLSDLIVTTAVMPISAVVLLSGEWDTLPVCHILQFLMQASTYSYSMFFGLVGLETYYRLCKTSGEYEAFMNMRIGLMSIMVFIIGFTTAGFGVYMHLDYDYCQRLHVGDFNFRCATSVILHGIPFLLAVYGLFCGLLRVRRRAREHVQYKRSQQFERDNSTTHLNLIAYLFYVIAWIPYLVVVNEFPTTSDNKYYQSAWIAVCRSVLTSFLYSSLNRNFRHAFAHLFYYCCCKSTLGGSFNSRHRRALEYKPATGDVRVHIMHQAVNMSTPQRAASSSRETQEL